MFRAKKSPQAEALAAVEKEAKLIYKFMDKHRDDQYEIDQYLNAVADKDSGRQILQKVQEMAAANLAAIKGDSKKNDAARKLHEFVKERAFAAELRKAAFESMVFSIKNENK